ncbi:MAG: ROK family protein [Planctomycetia bacterium]|nr:ROK family protein [Planctomycetia bacterium]
MSHQPHCIPIAEARLPLYVGVDLGGTNIKVGVVDDQGLPLSRLSIRTDPKRGPEDGAQRMAEAVGQAIRQAGATRDQVARVGLGSPGTMDIPAGLLLDPPNLPGWMNFPIRARLEKHCGFSVTFENDANAAAYGEFWVGCGRALRSMVMFTLGTGIGCGVIIDDLILQGEHSHGAECGHIIIDHRPDAPLCSCGQTGHLEAYCSAKGVVRRTREALARRPEGTLARAVAAGEELTPLTLAREAEAGDALSLEIVLDTARYLAVGVVNLMHTIDPNGVVLGGAMTFGGHESRLGRRFLEVVREEVHRRAFPVLAERTMIDFATLGGDAGFIGAAGVARLEHSRTKHA